MFLDWNPRDVLSDIALLKLTTAFTFDEAVQPACLPSIKFHPEKENQESVCVISGWGKSSNALGSAHKDNLQGGFKHNKIILVKFKTLQASYSTDDLEFGV